MLTLMLVKNKLHLAHIFQNIFFENFQIDLQVITFNFEHMNQDIHLDFLFQRLSILFLHANNQHL